jgi:hypothetical protein
MNKTKHQTKEEKKAKLFKDFCAMMGFHVHFSSAKETKIGAGTNKEGQ